MAEINISIINRSNLEDAEIEKIITDLQTQVSKHFAPVWGIDATLKFVPKGEKPALDSWWLIFYENSEKADKAGYHDVTNTGLPLGKVFVKTDILDKISWSVTASHELLEMLADPHINLTAFIQTGRETGMLYAYEVCDAVEDDACGYLIGDTLVSNFVYPSYYEPQDFGGATKVRYDHCERLSKPVPALLPGGYISQFAIPNSVGWSHALEKDGKPQGGSKTLDPGSRAERRQRRPDWKPSDPRFVPM